MRKTNQIKRGDVILADLSPVVGSEQGGVRPLLVVSNNIGNKYSPCIIGAAITSQISKAKLPTHVELSAEEFGLEEDSVLLLEQIRTIDKSRIQSVVTRIHDKEIMAQIDYQLAISFGFNRSFLSLMMEALPKLIRKRKYKLFEKFNSN